MKNQNFNILIVIKYTLIILMFTLVGCSKDEEVNDEEIEGTFIDNRDNKEYKWIKIGNQIWMAENLAYLPSIKPTTISGSTFEPCYYVYGYEGTDVNEAKLTENYNTYGALYNWEAATKAAPEGWHLPSDEEWKELEICIGMLDSEANKIGWRGTDQGKSLRAITNWEIGSDWSDGTDLWGFSALPAGFYYGIGGGNGRINEETYWWTATESLDSDSDYRAYYRGLFFGYNTIERESFGGFSKSYGLSVRCIKNSPN